MTGRLIPCIGRDGEFASDKVSRQAACKWLGDLIDEGKRWSEARGEIAQYYAAAGMEEGVAHAKSKGAKELARLSPIAHSGWRDQLARLIGHDAAGARPFTTVAAGSAAWAGTSVILCG